MTSSIFPTATKVTVRDKTIEIYPLPVKNIAKAATAASPLISALSVDKIDPVIVMQNADSVIELVAIGTGETVEWVGDLNIAELTELFGAVISQNADFFIQKALPTIQEMVKQVGQLAQKTQQEASTPS